MEVKSNDSINCTVALAGLYNVYDPEIGLNVVDLGLIYEIDFKEAEKIIVITMTLTTQFCPMGESITTDVYQTVGNAFKDYEVKINLVFDPAWGPHLISEEGQQFLNR